MKSFQSNGVCIIYESVIACMYIFLNKDVMVDVVNLAENRITRRGGGLGSPLIFETSIPPQ